MFKGNEGCNLQIVERERIYTYREKETERQMENASGKLLIANEPG
jgi:hypothetical protein